MPKGNGLGLGSEIRSGTHLIRAKRYSKIHKLFIDWDWPHNYGWSLSCSWKRHRKTQYKTKDVA